MTFPEGASRVRFYFEVSDGAAEFYLDVFGNPLNPDGLPHISQEVHDASDAAADAVLTSLNAAFPAHTVTARRSYRVVTENEIYPPQQE